MMRRMFVLLALTCLSAARAVEINERGQVIFQLAEGRIVQYADALSLADIRDGQWQPAGDENAVAAISGTDKLRFYRIAAEGESSPALYALGVVKLFPGKNWVGLWGDPEDNTLTGIFGNRLPAGMGFDLPQGESRVPSDVSAIEVELPAGSKPLELPIILKIPSEPVTQSIPKGKRILSGFRAAGRPQLDQCGLLEGGFTGGRNPVESDQLWKYDREKQQAPFAVWYCTTDGTWRMTSPSDFPAVPENYLRYDDAVRILIRNSNGISWTKSCVRSAER